MSHQETNYGWEDLAFESHEESLECQRYEEQLEIWDFLEEELAEEHRREQEEAKVQDPKDSPDAQPIA